MIAGRYRLVRELGRGASGVVHLAEDEMLGRLVALKRLGLAPGEDAADPGRSAREARIAAALSHPHVVAVYDLVEDDDVQWLVMEYVEGTTLSELIRRRGRLSPQEAAPLLAHVADALAEAHAHGIVHRDVKPGNIFVTPEGVAKLGDFGIARGRDDAALTRTGLVTGSPAYLAPEVLSGAQATPASDVWSFGATLFHALAGTPPYDIGDHLVSGLLRIVQDPVPMLADAGPLARVLDHTMVKNPEGRWTAADLAAELGFPGHTALDGHRTDTFVAPVAATASAEHGTPAARRRPGWLLAVAVLLTLVVLGGAGVAWMTNPRRTAEPPPSAATTDPATPPASASPDEPDTTDDATESAQAMEAFVRQYLGLVTSDPEQAFDMLTPEFQKASGGLSGYLSWWRTVESADVRTLAADPESLTVEYSVAYRMTNGERSTDRVRLQLSLDEEHDLIAGEG